MIFVDTTHTAHCAANTGIQRVTRRIVRELGADAQPVVYDRYGKYWRAPDADEAELVTYPDTLRPGAKRSANWSLRQQLRGHAAALGLHRALSLRDGAEALLVPEIFAAPRTAPVFQKLRAGTRGPAVAVFHDLIPLLMPGHTPAETVAKFETYLAALREFDAIAAVSEFSRDALLDYWRKRGESHPPVHAVPLGVDTPACVPPPPAADTARPVSILCVGTLEGRKNHLALLQAAESLWADGARFTLTLFGGLNRETGTPAAELAGRLIAAGRPLRWVRGGSDADMEAEYAGADFTVYPSLMEGFGLPVWESLSRGRPCVCSGENAMAETARAGGCVATGHPTPEALARTLGDLIAHPAKIAAHQAEARALRMRSWADYAADLRTLVRDLRR